MFFFHNMKVVSIFPKKEKHIFFLLIRKVLLYFILYFFPLNNFYYCSLYTLLINYILDLVDLVYLAEFVVFMT